jgi:hypothetical protein
MPGESKNGMQCAEFDALLNDALDHTLSAAKMESFQAHARVCPVCSLLKAEAEEGQRWMKSLAEVEPPANLVHNILAATTGVESAQIKLATPKPSWRDSLAAWFRPTFTVVRQPRFVMSFGMAFFSLSAVLSLSGVKASDVSHLDLRPAAVRRSYYEASGKAVKYYENIRFVYEIESRVRDIKRATTPAEPAPEEQNNKERKNDTSGQPEQRQERNYSQGENQPILASLPDESPVVTMTTYRRFV